MYFLMQFSLYLIDVNAGIDILFDFCLYVQYMEIRRSTYPTRSWDFLFFKMEKLFNLIIWVLD